MRRVRGDRAFSRLLKQLPESVEAEIRQTLKEVGAQVLTEQRSLAPVRTGKLRGALTMNVPPKSLRLQVGLIGKPVNRKFFYGRIQEFGRKAQSVRARRAGGKPYIMRIRGMAPKRFIYSVNREQIYAPFRTIWERALKAAAGVSDE